MAADGERADGERADGERASGTSRARRAWSIALVALLCTLATLVTCALQHRDTAAGDRPSGTAAALDDYAPALGRILDRRAAAVLDRDERALLGVVDPRARAFRAEQRAVFANLAEIPLDSWSYRLRGSSAFPLPDGPDRRVAAEVELRYRIEGFDPEPVTASEYLTFVEREGRWMIASDSDGQQAGKRTTAQLWDFGPVHALRGRHSLVLGLGDRDGLRRYSADAERAVRAVSRSWSAPWSRKVVMLVPRSLDQMAALLGGSPGSYRSLAAVTTGRTGNPADGRPADRITVNPEAFGKLSDLGRRVVATHETAHVATRADTAAWTPLWLSEGIADWLGYRDTERTPRQIAPELSRDVRAGRLPGSLPADADFGTDRHGLAQAYEKAWFAARVIADRYGQDTLVELYRAVGQRGERDGTDRVMRDVLGVGLDTFTEEWRTRMGDELGCCPGPGATAGPGPELLAASPVRTDPARGDQ